MRTVGRRQHAAGDRQGLDALVLRFGGGAPKGVFRYRTQEEANRDWSRWTSERVRRLTTTNSASGLTWDDLAPYRKRIEGIEVVGLEGLLRMKEHGRLKDQADAEAIREALGIK